MKVRAAGSTPLCLDLQTFVDYYQDFLYSSLCQATHIQLF